MSSVIDFEWEVPLRSFEGSRVLLQGVTVFHDFEWNQYFRRRALPNGKAFTKKVLEMNEAG